MNALADQHTASAGRLLRLMTCGSVDDGKSTLLGRLLVDTDSISLDHLDALRRDSRDLASTGRLDYSLLFDGLQDERQQSITIDVGYRYFSTAERSYVIADAPGHEQYTRNMATAASNADVAIILVDARKGILEQTHRHAVICSIFRVPHIVVCINKIDLMGYDQSVFETVAETFRAFSQSLGFSSLAIIPTSAALGDNVTKPSLQTPWYSGPSLLERLDGLDVTEQNIAPLRFPVQWINRPYDGFRGLSGTIVSGVLTVGDVVAVLPSRKEAIVKRIVNFEGDADVARFSEATTVVLDREIDISRGDLISDRAKQPVVSEEFTADLLWCSSEKVVAGRRYYAKFGGRTVLATIHEIFDKVDVADLRRFPTRSLGLNEIGRCLIRTISPVAIDSYYDNRNTGAFILIDRISRDTVAAGLIAETSHSTNLQWQTSSVTAEARAKLKGQQPVVIWFTGLPGAGKSTVADAVERQLFELGHHTMMLDGDNLRQGLNRDLGFSEEERVENIRRAAETARLMVDAGLIVLCCFITPMVNDRLMASDIIGTDRFIEVFVDTPIDECIRRDPKGLYARATRGEISNLTGLSAPYEPPVSADITIKTLRTSAERAAVVIVEQLAKRNHV